MNLESKKKIQKYLHEIMSPLTIINGYSEYIKDKVGVLMKMDKKKPELNADYAQIITWIAKIENETEKINEYTKEIEKLMNDPV